MTFPQPAVSFNGAERRTVGVLAGVYAVRMFGLFLLLPVLAIHAAALPGATPALAGLAVGAYGITQAFLQIPFGMASDRFGRKPVIVAGLVIFAAGSLLAASAESVEAIIAGRALQGAGAVSAAITALLADLTRPELRTRAMAIVGATIGLSFVFSLVGGPLLQGLVGVAGIFVLTGVAAVGAIFAIGWAVPAPRRRAAEPISGAGLRAALARPDLLALNFGIFALHFSLTAVFVVLPLSLQSRLGVAPGDQWSIYLTAMLLSLAGTVPMILLAERGAAPENRIQPAAAILVATGSLALIAMDVGAWVAVTGGLAVYFAGFNFLEARLPAKVSGLVAARERGAALGIYASAQFLGAFAGGAAGGAMFETVGAAGVLGLGAALLLGWAALVAMNPVAVSPAIE